MLSGRSEIGCVQAVFTEYNTASVNTLRFEEPACWAAFQGLQTQGILCADGHRQNNKIPMKRWPVILSVSPDDIKKGAGMSKHASSAVQDALCGVGGAERVAASAF